MKDTAKHPRTGRTLGKSHHREFPIILDVIHQGRTRLGEAHTANDGVRRAALHLYTLVRPLICLVGCVCCVCCPLKRLYILVKSFTDISRLFGYTQPL